MGIIVSHLYRPLRGRIIRVKEAAERLLGLKYRPKRYWEGAAARYTSERAGNPPSLLQRGWLRAVQECCGPTDVVLCAGAGPYQPTDELSVVSLDISWKMLSYRTGDEGPGLVVGDMRSLPFADDAFAIVGIVGALMHVPAKEHKRVLKECVRVASQSVVIAERMQATTSQINRKIWYPSISDVTDAFNQVAPRGRIVTLMTAGEGVVIRYDLTAQT